MVQNDEEELELIKRALQKIGKANQVQFFNSGMDLLQYLNEVPAQHSPSLVVLDYYSPVISGLQTIALIRSHQQHRQVPVVIYSSGSLPPLSEELKDLQVLTCLQRGNSFGKVVEQVRFLFELIADDVETLLGGY